MPGLFVACDAVEIAPGLLIGSAPSARQRRALAESGVTQVVDLRSESPRDQSLWPTSVRVLCAPTDATAEAEILAGVSELIADMVRSGDRVLVHRQSREDSVGAVMCAVLMRLGRPLDEAVDAVRRIWLGKKGSAPARPAALEQLEQRLRRERHPIAG